MKTARFSPLALATVAATILFAAPAGAASQFENQDAAFSLLIEAFGEVQGSLIESDYQARLAAARSSGDPAVRRHAGDLARQERDLRLGKLKRQIAEMAIAYHYSRRTDESDAGARAREQVDPAAAARKLREFVIVGVAVSDQDQETNASPIGERR